MSFLPYAVAGWLFCVGLYGVVSSRNLIHLAICLTVMQSATYVLLLAIGYKNKGTAPIFNDISSKHVAVDPIVQSLTLTDVVVSVTVLALILALALQAKRSQGTLDPDELAELKG
jgi:multicomponent Na+:H+ antiporter subunit C